MSLNSIMYESVPKLQFVDGPFSMAPWSSEFSIKVVVVVVMQQTLNFRSLSYQLVDLETTHMIDGTLLFDVLREFLASWELR